MEFPELFGMGDSHTERKTTDLRSGFQQLDGEGIQVTGCQYASAVWKRFSTGGLYGNYRGNDKDWPGK